MNLTILEGYVGKDADCNPVGATDVSRFTLATTESYQDRNGQWINKTTWHNIACWGGLAKVAFKYIKKGAHITVIGKINNESYEKDGIKRYRSEVVVSEFKRLDKIENSAPAPGPATNAPAPASAPDAFVQPVDDDLPF